MYIDLSIKTTTSNLGKQKSFIDILIDAFTAHLPWIKERLENKLVNNKIIIWINALNI